MRHPNLFSKHFIALKLTVVLRRFNYPIMPFNCNDESMPVQSRFIWLRGENTPSFSVDFKLIVYEFDK